MEGEMEQLGTNRVNKRQEEKARNKMIKDLFFLVNWVGEKDLTDVVAAKDVVPPEDTDILDVSAGMICRVSFSSKFYAARVVKSGTYAEVKQLQVEAEKEVDAEQGAEEGANTEEGTNVEEYAEKHGSGDEVMATIEPSPSEKLPRKSPPRKSPSLKQILHKITASKKTLISSKETKDRTGKRKRKHVHIPPKEMLFSFKRGSDSKSLAEGKEEDSEPLNFDDLFSVPAAAKPSSVQTFPAAKLSSKMSVKSASKQWQETHFRNGDDSDENDEMQRTEDSKRQRMDEQYGASLINQLQGRVGELEKTTKLLSMKLKQQAKEINWLRSSTSTSGSASTTRSSTPEGDTTASTAASTLSLSAAAPPKPTLPVSSITRDKDKIQICGRMVDNLKYQSAILHKDAGKCALQLLDSLFDTTELVNGNPSGQTNSKDPARKQSIRKLDPHRMSYICDFIEGKWPGCRSQMLRKITQKCTDLYNNRKDLRVTFEQ